MMLSGYTGWPVMNATQASRGRFTLRAFPDPDLATLFSEISSALEALARKEDGERVRLP